MEKKRLIIIIVIAAAGVVLLLAAGLLLRRVPAGTVARVGKTLISEEDVTDRVWFKTNFTQARGDVVVNDELREITVKELIEQELLVQEAAARNISLSDEEIETAIKKSGALARPEAPSDEMMRALRSVWRYNLLKERVTEAVVSKRAADYVYAPFFLNFFKDKDRYTQDRIYASGLADTIYSKLKTGEINIEQAIALARDDERIGVDVLDRAWGWQYFSYGGTFDAESFRTFAADSPEKSFESALKKAAEGLNKPVVVEVVTNADSPDADNVAPYEGAFVIINITLSEKKDFDTYEQWRAAAEAKYGVTRYDQ